MPGPKTTTTQASSDTTSPWEPQQSYLTNAFQQAQDAYNNNMAQGAYSGDYVAQPTQQQYDAYGNAVNQGYAAQGANNGILANSAANSAAGSAGAQSALSTLNGLSTTDQTANNIANANKYVTGFNIPGEVQAAMLQANQNASENGIPNIYRSAAAAGGVNASGAQLAQGVVERGLAQQAAGLSAQLSNQDYGTGLNLSQQGYGQQVQAASDAANAGINLNQSGINGTQSAINNQSTIDNQITSGANGATGLNQQVLNNLMAKYNGGQQFTSQQLQNLMAVIGGKWGTQSTGNSTGTSQVDPSLLQNIGSGIGILGSLF